LQQAPPRILQILRTAGYWTAPSIAAVVLYWPGLVCWFQKDDFTFLKLLQLARESQGFRWALFAPLGQGTIRTISERAFFLSFSAMFGLNALPYRICVFLTFAASLMLLASITAKLTRSRAAGFWAAVFWTVNSAMGVALSWTAIYYYILFSFTSLAALWLLIRYSETGERRYFLAQWIVFLFGFGVLELNVVYPAFAAAYAVCCDRRLLFKTLPMFGASAAYAIVHALAAPLPTAGPYRMHLDASIFSTLWTYWKIALGPVQLIYLRIYPSPFRSLLAILLMLGLLGFLAFKICCREGPAVFFALWFLISMSLVLPLRDHIDQYYLTQALTGLAMWGAWAAVSGWRASPLGKSAAVLLVAIYLLVEIPVARVVCRSFYDRSIRIERVLEGVAAQAGSNKDALILLKGVDSDLFWSALSFRPFPVYGLNNVYLLSGESSGIAPPVPDSRRSELFREPENRQTLVLDVSGGTVRRSGL